MSTALLLFMSSGCQVLGPDDKNSCFDSYPQVLDYQEYSVSQLLAFANEDVPQRFNVSGFVQSRGEDRTSSACDEQGWVAISQGTEYVYQYELISLTVNKPSRFIEGNAYKFSVERVEIIVDDHSVERWIVKAYEQF
jgi:hypothetical protein